MWGMKRGTAAAACFGVCAALAVAAPACATVEVDQSALVVSDGVYTDALPFDFGSDGRNNNISFVQSVTAGKAGFLDHIDIQLEGPDFQLPTVGTVTLSLYDGDYAAGPVNLIATQKIAAADLPVVGPIPTGYVDFDVRSANFAVTGGQVFSFGMSYGPDDNGYVRGPMYAVIGKAHVIGQLPEVIFNAYDGGVLTAVSSTTGIVGPEYGDVGFRTFVDVTREGAVPEPATWAMMLAGFGALGSTLRRKTARVAFA